MNEFLDATIGMSSEPVKKKEKGSNKFLLYMIAGCLVVVFFPMLFILLRGGIKRKKKPSMTIVKEGLLWNTTYKVYK